VKDEEQLEEVETALQKHPDRQLLWLKYVFDTISHQGPTTGLLAAHASDGGTHWMVTGCDYPLLETEALLQLASEHDKTPSVITCFQNSDGWTEPLLAIWAPSALKRLLEMSLLNSHIGPNRAIKAFSADESDAGSESTFSSGVCTVQPLKEFWTRSVDTKEDWDEVRKMLYAAHEKDGK
jgi:molybdopterin-guanine dinucleotide biosynthesis protein A